MVQGMYHERQTRQMCLVHTLNSLLQRKEFTPSSLDAICESLNESKWFNPHRSWVGLGNYDVNVLMSALAMHDLKMVWFDRRLPLENINFPEVHAVIANIPSSSIIPFWNGRHWFTILKKDDGNFVNLDSKLQHPEEVPEILTFLKKLVARHGNDLQVLLISKNDADSLVRK